MAIAKYVKAQIDRKRYQIDYTDWLDTGELVTPLAHWTEHRVEGINQVEWHDSTGIVAVEYL